MRLARLFLTLLVLGWATTALAADVSTLKFPSPNKRFALRMTELTGDDSDQRRLELIEKGSGKVLVKLGLVSSSHVDDIVLVWSADSKRMAYGTRTNKEGEAGICFWNGSAFEEVSLPKNIPDPDIKFRKGAGADVKNYGGAVQPVRWLKSGALEMSNDFMLLSRVDDHSYTGTVLFTVIFDAKHHASVKTLGKTKTEVD